MVCAVHGVVPFVVWYSVTGFEAAWSARTVSADPRAESGPIMLFCIKLLTFMKPLFEGHKT